MHTLTHALLPVIAVAVDRQRTDDRGTVYWSRGKLCLLALAGALPDLLNPHLSLQARYTSWSHGLPALLGFAAVLAVIWILRRKSEERLFFLLLAAAYELHLWCDLISGGIAWWYPFGSGVAGAYYISPKLWVPLDIACLLLVYFIYRAIPNFCKWCERRKKFTLW